MRGPAGLTRFVSFLAREAKPSTAPLAPAVERVGGREHGVDGDAGGIRHVFSLAFQAGELVLFIHGGWQPSGAAAPAIFFTTSSNLSNFQHSSSNPLHRTKANSTIQ